MRPVDLKTRIFLDSGDPNETREALNVLGFLDGQTTNPSLIAKNPQAAKQKNLLDFYRDTVREISALIPDGSVSVEVYADKRSTAADMLKQGFEMFQWIPNAHIKFPITYSGLAAAERAVRYGWRINMTLCFSQEQAAAVFLATKGAQQGQVFVSPFVGRLDDQGENGADLVSNILFMYPWSNSHVEVLTASVRHLDHLLYAIGTGSHIVTAPLKVLKEWADKGKPMSNYYFPYDPPLRKIPYRKSAAIWKSDWKEMNIRHPLTDAGLQKFADDWNKMKALIE